MESDKELPYYSWSFLTLGIIQLLLLYNFVKGYLSISFTILLLPSMSYCILNILQSLSQLFSFSSIPKSYALRCLVHISTMILYFLALFIVCEEQDLGFGNSLNGFVPLFMALVLHMLCRVLEERPVYLTFIFNILTPALNVCTVSGACSSFYLSTLSSIFSAFGASVMDLMHIFTPVTYVLLGCTMYSIYYTKKSPLYPPFVLGMIASGIIVWAQNGAGSIVVMAANFMLLIAVFWNNIRIKQENFQIDKLV
jgi:hypothetical protein